MTLSKRIMYEVSGCEQEILKSAFGGFYSLHKYPRYFWLRGFPQSNYHQWLLADDASHFLELLSTVYTQSDNVAMEALHAKLPI